MTLEETRREQIQGLIDLVGKTVSPVLLEQRCAPLIDVLRRNIYGADAAFDDVLPEAMHYVLLQVIRSARGEAFDAYRKNGVPRQDVSRVAAFSELVYPSGREAINTLGEIRALKRLTSECLAATGPLMPRRLQAALWLNKTPSAKSIIRHSENWKDGKAEPILTAAMLDAIHAYLDSDDNKSSLRERFHSPKVSRINSTLEIPTLAMGASVDGGIPNNDAGVPGKGHSRTEGVVSASELLHSLAADEKEVKNLAAAFRVPSSVLRNYTPNDFEKVLRQDEVYSSVRFWVSLKAFVRPHWWRIRATATFALVPFMSSLFVILAFDFSPASTIGVLWEVQRTASHPIGYTFAAVFSLLAGTVTLAVRERFRFNLGVAGVLPILFFPLHMGILWNDTVLVNKSGYIRKEISSWHTLYENRFERSGACRTIEENLPNACSVGGDALRLDLGDSPTIAIQSYGGDATLLEDYYVETRLRAEGSITSCGIRLKTGDHDLFFRVNSEEYDEVGKRYRPEVVSLRLGDPLDRTVQTEAVKPLSQLTELPFVRRSVYFLPDRRDWTTVAVFRGGDEIAFLVNGYRAMRLRVSDEAMRPMASILAEGVAEIFLSASLTTSRSWYRGDTWPHGLEWDSFSFDRGSLAYGSDGSADVETPRGLPTLAPPAARKSPADPWPVPCCRARTPSATPTPSTSASGRL
ncbi:hypothetical protein [Micromonospora sp. NPDC092111]|uniref:hypothetical protein n=1 Tax=Micromonospora sp. NPDC092111 TaxID=3364289 RepID=UPI0037FB73E7